MSASERYGLMRCYVHARPSADTEPKRNVKPRSALGHGHRGHEGTSGDAADGAASCSCYSFMF